ncbi:hypothetical protein [Agromyces soli]|uniref:Uncharacterized protein n=1 Tax=Agromyces soli TaxID=659012 RepID=A0ABY4AWK0_9MICO|nr:hypothetical protein [Agromyces soli]UOE27534.1 hypothetical protein MTP13_07080 [Agromyces soli]
MTKQYLARWFDDRVREMQVAGSYFATNHIDEIAGFPEKLDLKSLAAELVELGALAHRHGAGIVPVLIIPLGISDALDVNPPELTKVSFGTEPPSFYLMEPRYFSSWSDREEYRSPYRVHPRGPILVEYVCGRSMQMREQGWEYDRMLFLRTTTDGISLQGPWKNQPRGPQ